MLVVPSPGLPTDISPAVLALIFLLFNQSLSSKTYFATQMSPRGALSHLSQLSAVQVPFLARSLASGHHHRAHINPRS